MAHPYFHRHLHKRGAPKEQPTGRLDHIYNEKISFDWCELIAVIDPTASRALTVGSDTIPQTNYKDHDDYHDLAVNR